LVPNSLNDIVWKARHYQARLWSVGYLRLLELLGYRGSRAVHVDPGARILNPRGLTMGPGVWICRDAKLECAVTDGDRIGTISLGERIFVGERTSIVSYQRITIGGSTMIGHNCSIMDNNHGTERGDLMANQQGRMEPVSIGEDCWLGVGVIVLPGVTIGKGTVVGAGAVVTRSLPENVVAAGVPARVVRPR
jgi:acetyltransferase-like isoleucine patch superfamily enzyme